MSSSRITRSASAAAAAEAAPAAEAEPGSLSDIEDAIANAAEARTDDEEYSDSHDSFADVEVEVDDEQSFPARARGRPPGIRTQETDWQGKGTCIGSCAKTTEAKKHFRDGLGFRLKKATFLRRTTRSPPLSFSRARRASRRT